MAYKKLRQRHRQTQKNDKNTDTVENKDKTQRQREKTHKQRHSGQENYSKVCICEKKTTTSYLPMLDIRLRQRANMV